MRKIYPVVVDYSISLADMVTAGDYDPTPYTDVPAMQFLLEGTGQIKVEIQLVHFFEYVTTEEVLNRLELQGVRPAKVEELLAFGVAYPEKQRRFPIVALGSKARGDSGRHCCVSLTDGGLWADRRCQLEWFDGPWSEEWHFAAVGK